MNISLNFAARNVIYFLVATILTVTSSQAIASHSVARIWNEELLSAIRNDFARPIVHARNLFHTSIAMWDAWAIYDSKAQTYILNEKSNASDISSARDETISYAVYRVLTQRFSNSPGADVTLPSLDATMCKLGYDKNIVTVIGESPAAIGNRIAAVVLAHGMYDGANEQGDYLGTNYRSANRFHPLQPFLFGNSGLYDPNRWQPLAFDIFVDQAGNQLVGPPPFQGPHWGSVAAFALQDKYKKTFVRNDVEYDVYHDPGPPPLLGAEGDSEYLDGFIQVVEWSSQLDPSDGVLIDISPNARGNNKLGTNDGEGHHVNPYTETAYSPQIVPAGDYYRVLAEFWADGPDSETPPGHWFSIANYVSDQLQMEKRIAGKGPIIDNLEWDVKLYFALGSALHDAAVAAWGIKGWYDYVRPISAIRYMAGLGQRTDPNGPSYDPRGIKLVPGLVEIITLESIAPGKRHEHLAGPGNTNVDKVAAYTWRGPDYITDPESTVAGVGWILLQNWWPYQRPTFVTPPFAGYVSGHSTFSRAAAELLTKFTGSPYFPGGIGEFKAIKNEFLVFEDGPSVDITLQWATYRDASDETSISRIYGGIHPRADDIPGRIIGAKVGIDAFTKACTFYSGC